MPFTTRSYHTTGSGLQYSVGPTSSFGENFAAMFRQQRRVDSAFGMQIELQERFEEQLALQQEMGAGDFKRRIYNIRSVPGMSYALRKSIGQPLPKDHSLATRQYEEQLQEFNERAMALKEENPNIKTFDELVAEERAARQEIIEESGDISERAGFLGTLGGFAGAVAGSFDPLRDPLLVGSLLIPVGAGRSLAMKVLSEAAIGGGVETAQQGLFVQPRREALGEEGPSMLQSILAAAVGAGALRGAFEGAAAGVRRFQRGREAEALGEALGPDTSQGLAQAVGMTRVQDQEILDFIDRLPDTPEALEAKIRLRQDQRVKEGAPFAPQRPGLQAARRTVQEAERILNDVEPRAPDEAQLAVTQEERFLEMAQLQRGEPEAAMLRVQRAMGGGVLNPVVENLGDLQHRVGEVVRFGEDEAYRNFKDKVKQVNRYLTSKYGFEKELKENIRTNAKALELDEDRMQAAVDDSLTQFARAHEALPAYNDLHRTIRAANVAIGEQRWGDARDLVAELMDIAGSKKRFADAALVDDTPTVPRRFEPKPAAERKIQQGIGQYLQTMREEASIEDTFVDQVKDRALASGLSEDAKTVDLGTGEDVSLDRAVPDPERPNETRTARQVLEEIKDDDDMLQASTQCIVGSTT